MIIFAILIVFGIYMMIRNELVYKFRTAIAHDVFHTENGKYTWKEKLRVYEKISYHKMFFEFWKPFSLKSWYTDEEILILTT